MSLKKISKDAIFPQGTSCNIHETACCGIRHSRLNMANKCLIHCANNIGAAEPLTNFSEVSFKRFLECRRQWLGLDGGAEDFAKYAYHRKCYSLFTNKALLNRAEIRCKKAEETQTLVDQGESSANADCAENEPIPKKVLRSNFNASTRSMSTAVSKSEHVLPPICIICKKEKVYHLDRVSLQLIVFISHIFCVEMHQSVLTYLPIALACL